ncbi:cold shock and DUF1294 domain-containing protein [Psychromonas sp. 14N.309.X.WAT.B.A12]|uniref:cold shock and DUF1294 domain-containing protein n=1 Tax=Psychromonas sp. 14N.309.X.WAT.B.A12 TaxID=2998322 RepID=UPI0025B15BCC|nr:cold shock and DUF1294 domain-containing protein [Psychromonas sp. 14N.309.X.WAT.B.A12]MDN2662729.1 cold shock and DUF1294 domain-containing protein [Psychromonas sp. 14N.309.X.WAT.B.A12]
MKFQGKVINWNDDKGFGFVEPNGGGTRAFVHIKAFNSRSRRPVNGELIIYELVHESGNRYKATNIRFARDNNKEKTKSHERHSPKNSKPKNSKPKSYILSSIFTVLFCIGLVLAVFSRKLPFFIGFAYVLISLITILVYAQDKYSAQTGRWRTSVATLHFLSLIGGWPGALIAQKVLRHKTSKSEFISTYRVTVFFNIATLLIIYTEQGQYLLHDIVLPFFK